MKNLVVICSYSSPFGNLGRARSPSSLVPIPFKSLLSHSCLGKEWRYRSYSPLLKKVFFEEVLAKQGLLREDEGNLQGPWKTLRRSVASPFAWEGFVVLHLLHSEGSLSRLLLLVRTLVDPWFSGGSLVTSSGCPLNSCGSLCLQSLESQPGSKVCLWSPGSRAVSNRVTWSVGLKKEMGSLLCKVKAQMGNNLFARETMGCKLTPNILTKCQ